MEEGVILPVDVEGLNLMIKNAAAGRAHPNKTLRLLREALMQLRDECLRLHKEKNHLEVEVGKLEARVEKMDETLDRYRSNAEHLEKKAKVRRGRQSHTEKPETTS